MSNRSTAYIATIHQMDDIPDKDRIKYASLKNLGFKVIVGSDLQIGQKVVYIEVDTIIPESCAWAESLRSRCYAPKYKGFRIRALKLAGLYSEGIVFKTDEIDPQNKLDLQNKEDGFDLSDLLGIKSVDDDSFSTDQPQEKQSRFQRLLKKYGFFLWKLLYSRRPESKAFPSYACNKSDETRGQKMNYLFSDKWKGQKVYISTKMDGQSASFVIHKNRFIIASRNYTKYNKPLKFAIKDLTSARQKKFNDDFICAACKYDLPRKMDSFRKIELKIDNFALQAELCGPTLQKNPVGLDDNA